MVPLLRTHPSLKVWVAGCSAGKRCIRWPSCCGKKACWTAPLIYATDINPHALRAAESGIVRRRGGDRSPENHARSGARSSLSDYYAAA